VALIALALLPPQDASAQAGVIPCEGDFIPLGVLDPPGAWTYPGGRLHVRGMIGLYQQVMPGYDPRCSGLNTVVTNANWDASGVGPSWGTFCTVLEKEGDSGWEGTWTGKTYADGATSIRVEGHGYGDLEGQHVFMDIGFPSMDAWGDASGYILEPDGE